MGQPLRFLVAALPVAAASAQPLQIETLRLATPDAVGHAAADFDGDGFTDLFLARAAFVPTRSLPNRLLIADRFGRFVDSAPGAMPSQIEPTLAAATADVDGDGDFDLILGQHFAGPTRLWLNDGGGRFADATTGLPQSGNRITWSLLLADLDGDGDPDLVEGNQGQNRLLRNDGSGVFSDLTSGFPTDTEHTSGIAAGDVDGDGDLDLLFGNGRIGPEQTRLFRNDGGLTFTDMTGSWWPTGASTTRAVAFGDVDGDGDLDAFLGNTGVITGAGVQVEADLLYRNDGSGGYTATIGWASSLPLDFTTANALIDLDEDGDLDYCAASAVAGITTFYRNDGASGFVRQQTALPLLREEATGLATGDLDRDGDPDLIQIADGVSVWLAGLRRQIETVQQARPGGALQFTLHARPRPGASTETVVPVLAGSPALPPIRLAPLGIWLLDPSDSTVLPWASIAAAQGTAVVSVSVPPRTSLVGLPWFAQAMHLHGATASDWRMSNATAGTVLP